MSNKTPPPAKTEEATPALVPKLRFPEFREAEGWIIGKVDEIVDTITPPKKLPTSNYAATGTFPIIDQSQSDICGWTDDNEALIQDDLPLIVFGDHTCILKLIDRPFAQGADGIKILKSRPKIGTSFLYQFLNYRPVVTEEYKRHYSILKEKAVFFPDFKTGEQQKIAECLSSVDELIAAQARKLDALKTHKKGLMQQLFPREGETQPRLRFPEFQNTGEWETKRVDERGNVLAGKALAVNAPGPLRPYLRTKNVLDGAIDLSDVLTMPMTDAEFSRFEILDGDILLNEGQSLGLVGRASIYRGEFGQRCAMQNALLRFRAFPSTCPEFAAQAFQQCQKDGTFASIATQTTSVAHLGSSRFGALELAWPPTLAEQQRIADCLSSLDDLIAAQTQTLEALKTHKQGLMQQLFPSPSHLEP